MFVKYHTDNVKYFQKPSNKEIQKINQRITTNLCETSIKELTIKISEGYCILPFEMSGKRSKNNFRRTNLIFLDFDNSHKVEGVVQKLEDYFSVKDCLKMKFTQENASFIYETFSSKKSIQRFRLVFQLDNYIENILEFKEVYNNLLKIYPQADEACNDCARIFFGGNHVKIINPQNVLKLSKLNSKKPTQKKKSEYKHTILNKENFFKEDIYTISALKENNLTYIKNKYQTVFQEFHKSEFEDDLELISAFNKLSMFNLFGISSNVFCCILSEEKNPSCSVLKLDNGDYIYKRFSKNNQYTLNNFQLLQKLFKYTFTETLNLIKDLFDLKVTSTEKVNKVILNFLSDIKNKDLKMKYPKFFKLFYKYRNVIEGLFQVMFKHPIYVKRNDKPEFNYISTYGTRTLAEKVLGVDKTSIDTKRKRINKLLLSLTYINLLQNISTEDLPISIANYSNVIKSKSKSKNRVNVYKLNIENLSLDFLEKYIKENIPESFTVSKMSAEFILINKKADSEISKIIPQSDKKKITKKTTHLISDIDEYIKLKLSTQTYILDKDLKLYLEQKYSKKFLKTHYISVIKKLTSEKNYSRSLLTRTLRDSLKITDIAKLSSPTIIYAKFY